MATRKSNQRFMAWSIVAIILLLATSGYLYWNSMQLTKKLNLHKQELAAVELTQGQLEQDYELALTSLDDLKGENTDLNELIETQKLELKNQKNKISNLIWKSGKLNEAKKEIENLKNEALSFIDEINKLKSEKANLQAENSELKTATVQLKSTIDNISEEKDFISKEKDSILIVKERLKKENAKLNIKAVRASVIEIQEIAVTGYDIKESGKLSRKRKAKNIEMLKICFKILPNELADADKETFYIRILSPAGETIYKTQLGAGIFTKATDNTKTKYTFDSNFKMPLSEEIVCANYETKETILPGLYQVEIYNKGYLSGLGSFNLK
jgi:hypothetical protein